MISVPTSSVTMCAASSNPTMATWLDTGRPAPDDIYGRDDMPVIDENNYVVGPRSIVVLVAQQQSMNTSTP